MTPDRLSRTAVRHEIPLSSGFRTRFKLERILGAGGSSTVHLAVDRLTDQPVAIKFLSRAGDVAERNRFLHEAWLLARIDHVNVVTVRETGEESGHPYLVMDYLPGGTLRKIMKSHGRLPLTQAIDIAADLLAGLEACHARGIVHRDLKPDNVLLDQGGRARIADLGISLDRTRGDTFEAGSLVGTPKYMAPEQALGETAQPASDLYAVGLILFEMLAGQAPFEGASADDLLRRHVSDAPAPIQGPVPWVSDALAALIARALAKRPEARPPSAQAFRAALLACRPAGGPAVARPTYRIAVDREIFERVRAADQTALALLHHEYASLVRSYLLRNAGPMGLRERTAMVFRIALENLNRADGPVSIAHWLLKIASAVAEA